MDSNNNISEDIEEFEIRHEYADDYRVLPATGISGGRQPGGNVRIDFVLDNNPRIESELVGIDNVGRVVTTLDDQQENFARRTHQIGISMSPENAFNAACWIIAEMLTNYQGLNISQEEVNDLVADHYGLSQTNEEMW